jgi:hypothetical protein
MGWGYTDYNTVLGWGSGFTDVWDSPANQPPGTSHWQGIQALHYHNGTNGWGFQIACGAGNTDLLYIRGAWGGTPSTWKRIVVGDSRNSRGATRLYRRDEDNDFSVQTYWTGSRWRLIGYNGDTYHADTHVGYAENGFAAWCSVLGGAGFGGNPLSISIQDGSNVTNVTRTSTGVYRINLSITLPDTNYAILVSSTLGSAGVVSSSWAQTSYSVFTQTVAGTPTNAERLFTGIMS